MTALAPIILISISLLVGDGGVGAPAYSQPSRLHSGHTAFGLPQLEIVDQGVEDITPLSASLRQIDGGFALPMNFEYVYRLSSDHYMRAHGALFAVFPRSTYLNTPIGNIALIPENTVFYIGAPPDPDSMLPLQGPWPTVMEQAPESRDILLFAQLWMIDHRVSTQNLNTIVSDLPVVPERASAAQRREATPTAPDSAPPVQTRGTIFGDEAYRSERIEMLMRRAASEAGHSEK